MSYKDAERDGRCGGAENGPNGLRLGDDSSSGVARVVKARRRTMRPASPHRRARTGPPAPPCKQRREAKKPLPRREVEVVSKTSWSWAGPKLRSRRHTIELFRHPVCRCRRLLSRLGPLDTHASPVYEVQAQEPRRQRADSAGAFPSHGLAVLERPAADPCVGGRGVPPAGAIAMASPGARKGLAGKCGELTPLRQRGGRGVALSLTHSIHPCTLSAAPSGSDAPAPRGCLPP